MKIDEKHAWKKRIALDIDGTIWDFYGPFFEFYNNKYGTNHKLEDYTYDLKILLDTTQNQLSKDFKEFENSPYCDNLILYEDVEKILYELSQKYFFVLITAKDSSHRDVVVKRLKEKLPKFDFPIYFSGDFVGASGGKDEICKEIGCEAIIEDNLCNALTCAKSGITSVLIDRFWNRAERFENENSEIINEENTDWKKNFARVKEWKEVLEIFD